MSRSSRQQHAQTPRQTPLTDAVLQERTGLTAQHLQPVERARRVGAAMLRAGFTDDAAFATFLRASQGSLLDLASALAVGETYFFRDQAQLKLFTDQLLPRLLLDRPRDHVLRIWSAGCASGEEPYTIAMLLDERGLLERAHIVATDISQAGLEQARLGVYSSWSLRGTPTAAIQRYLRPAGRLYELSPALRQHVRFERESLMGSLPGADRAEFDLIFCRNVLIYFTPETCTQVSRRLAHSLTPGGTLLTGASDPFAELAELWQRQTQESGVTYTRLPLVSARPALGAERVDIALARPSARADTLLARRGGLRATQQPAIDAPGRAVGPHAPAAKQPTEPAGAQLPAPADGEAIRALAKHEGTQRAVEVCRQALALQPLSAELHLLHASLLIELGRDEEAAAALRSLLYLDAGHALGHFLSALVFRRQGERRKAARAYRRVVALCATRADDEPVPWGDGVSHRSLSEAAAHAAHALDRRAGTI